MYDNSLTRSTIRWDWHLFHCIKQLLCNKAIYSFAEDILLLYTCGNNKWNGHSYPGINMKATVHIDYQLVRPLSLSIPCVCGTGDFPPYNNMTLCFPILRVFRGGETEPQRWGINVRMEKGSQFAPSFRLVLTHLPWEKLKGLSISVSHTCAHYTGIMWGTHLSHHMWVHQ